jgi:hypothetical protein
LHWVPRQSLNYGLEITSSQLERTTLIWRRGWSVCLITLLVTALFCLVHSRWTPAQWLTPVHYDGDALEVLARIKAAAEGDLAPLLPQRVARLGAPGEAIWDEYPGSDPWANFALGQVARTTGVGMASNLALWFAHLSAALIFYGCARFLGHRREWALTGALLFAFSYFSFNRGLPHLWLVFTWQVPLALLTCWLIGGGGRVLQRRWVRWLCVGTALALGASNPYNLFLYLQLLTWSLIVAWRRADGGLNRRLGVGCLVAALVMFALTNLPVWLYADDKGGVPLLTRNYAGTEIYALKPIELLLPPADHRSGLLGSLGSRYVRWSDWQGETFSPYLGVVGIVGLVWLLLELALRLAARRDPRPDAPGLQALWILLFSSIGGVNSILAFYFGLQVFRASNRYSIFLLALALFFIIARLSKLTWTWPATARWGLVAGIITLGLWDQIPRPPDAGTQANIAKDHAADRALGLKLEKELGAGALVFQLPVMDFPEGWPRHRLKAYDHFRAYLGTDTTRFSFGARKGRAIGRWQRDYDRMPPDELFSKLELIGFNAVLIDPSGYSDIEPIDALLLAAANRARTLNLGDDPRILIQLQPAKDPRPPLAREPTHGQGWHPRGRLNEGGLPPPSQATPVRPAGFRDAIAMRARMGESRTELSRRMTGSFREEEIRWAHSDAVLKYHNPGPETLRVQVEMWLSAPDERKLELHCNRVPVADMALDEHPRLLELQLTLRPGVNRLDFITDRPAVRVSEQRWSLRALALHELVWNIELRRPVELADK